jgi:predicted proteasome-type protease
MTYQEDKRLELENALPPERSIATVAGVYSDGLTLQFDGESAAGTKRYKYNKAVTFAVGDRVLVVKTSGTYVAICVVG